ncbi:MAG: mechanosensitive ion channel [Propionivibrio sp.]|nr:mechanosensitive ion channel [Propionivibrio sp.]
MTTNALAQEPVNPLKPVDRSSPRTALKTFLDAGDALGAFLAQDYLPSPSREEFGRLISLSEKPLQSLDLSEVAPAARPKTGRAAAVALYEVLSRIPLPPVDEIPDASQAVQSADKSPTRWVIPDTEIAFVRAANGPHSNAFLFSPETVARAGEFYERVRHLPYRRPLPLNDMHDLFLTGGAWMIPYAWIQSLPASLRAPIANQSAWKWIGLAMILALFGLFLLMAYRVSQLGDHRSRLLRALAQFAMPASVLAATPLVAYLALVQINLAGSVGSAIELALSTLIFLAGAWMAWRLAPVVAEGIIASPRIAPESIDAHVIRIGARLLGILAGMALLAIGADRLGVPVYGVVAGLGVGGLAVALAARPTVENLIGSMSLFADKPIRIGDICKYGDTQGTVEAIGLRSSRLRSADRTVTTIPNEAMARMPIVNLTQRDRILLKAVISLRYETTPELLRYVLATLREMLLSHPRVDPEKARARFIGFAASSLDIEVFAYVMTKDWAEFLGIQEDILLRIMALVEECGAAFAFPSQTLYMGRDRGPDDAKSQAAEAVVRKWREEGALPFPDFSPEQAGRIRGSIATTPGSSTT